MKVTTYFYLRETNFWKVLRNCIDILHSTSGIGKILQMPLTTFSDLEIIVQCAPEFECNIYKTENPYFINDKVASATKETKILNIRIEAE